MLYVTMPVLLVTIATIIFISNALIVNKLRVLMEFLFPM